MKSQENIVNSDWEGGKPFLSKAKNEELSIEHDYYKGREHLLDPKAKKTKQLFSLARAPGWARFGGFIFFAVFLISELNFIESVGVGILTGVVSLILLWLKKTIFEEGLNIKYNPDDEDMHRSLSSISDLSDRTFDINTADKMFTDDRNIL